MKKLLMTIAIATVLCQMSFNVSAAIITYTDFYSNTIVTAGTSGSQQVNPVPTSAIHSFNSSMGTLEDVKVSVHGSVILSGNTGAHLVPAGLAGVIPVPYNLDMAFSLDIDGFGGEFFSFGSPLEVHAIQAATGYDLPVAAVANFAFTYDYTDVINQFLGPTGVACAGATYCLPPSTMAGNLEGFIEDNILIDQMLFKYGLTVSANSLTPYNITASSQVFVDTTYTFSLPVIDPDPSDVPEPSTIALFAAGIFGIGIVRRRKS